ncbi:MAG TPA: maleylpyruvate isomerase N-terminal domain-containing protein [Anaerolineaceae bacterium]|nr:maleylpyruvate isomerase N-terminal domain-containing protein [Anaerolineaceae bacterium]HPN50255.1 maleylpyruvate isomerase N-terminal domain-containing protein [Anaerolineaceae bacterium]
MDIETTLQSFNTAASRLANLFNSLPDPDLQVYEFWTARDLLMHLTFWHESFARNVSDLAAGRKPHPLRGRLSDLNQQGVESMRNLPPEAVLARFQSAHALIQQNILNPALTLIPYKVGSRGYTPQEHLDIVQAHITQHTCDIEKAVSKRRPQA